MNADLKIGFVALAVAISLGLARDLAHNEAVSSSQDAQPHWIAASVYGSPSSTQSGSGGWDLNDSKDETLPASRDTTPEQ
jgi:hypothetical protein